MTDPPPPGALARQPPAVAFLALREDVPRIDRILDVLREAVDVRLFAVDLADPRWPDIVETVRASRCAFFCWSRSTAQDGEDSYGQLAAELLARGDAVGIELDPATRPPILAGMTTYDVSGWRSRTAGWRSFFADKVLYKDIIAAAQAKVAGKDPPSQSAVTSIAKGQIYLILLTVGAIASVLSFPDVVPKPRFNERAAWRALPDNSCPHLRRFIQDYPDGIYIATAQAIYDQRLRLPTSRLVTTTRRTSWSAGGGDAEPLRDRAAAEKRATDPAGALARKQCEGYYGAAAGSVVAGVRHTVTAVHCTPLSQGWICSAEGDVDCDLQERVEGPVKEVCKLPPR